MSSVSRNMALRQSACHATTLKEQNELLLRVEDLKLEHNGC